MEKRQLKFYFAGSIRGEKDAKESYPGIIEFLKKFGEVNSEHLFLKQSATLTDREINERDCLLIDDADIIVAENTAMSEGVSFEIGYAFGKFGVKKPVLLLRKSSKRKIRSAMTNGSPSVYRLVRYKNLDDLFEQLQGLIAKIAIELQVEHIVAEEYQKEHYY
jgi:nucleoside 2-deoxyribosyltransferase